MPPKVIQIYPSIINSVKLIKNTSLSYIGNYYVQTTIVKIILFVFLINHFIQLGNSYKSTFKLSIFCFTTSWPTKPCHN